MKKALLALAVAGAAVSAQADVKLSGHVNYAAGDLEDFNGNNGFSVDNADSSQSRFRIVASKKADGITYGLREEFGLVTGGSEDVVIRVNEFYLKGDFGKVSLGQGSEAGDGATEKDFSGTYVLTGGSLWTWDVNGSIQQNDGGRDERLKYDTPKLGGIATLSVDLDDADNVGFGLDLNSGGNWQAGLYHESKDANDADETGASFALKAGVITAALQLSTRDATGAATNDDRDFSKFILGYRSGAISVALDVNSSEINNGATADNESTGLSLVYRPTGGVELYGGVRNLENKLTNVDGDGVLIGGRVRF